MKPFISLTTANVFPQEKRRSRYLSPAPGAALENFTLLFEICPFYSLIEYIYLLQCVYWNVLLGNRLICASCITPRLLLPDHQRSWWSIQKNSKNRVRGETQGRPAGCRLGRHCLPLSFIFFGKHRSIPGCGSLLLFEQCYIITTGF